MGLFNKSEEEKITDEFMGNRLLKRYFSELIDFNGLYGNITAKEDLCIAYDIRKNLTYKLKTGELTVENFELEFYYLIKVYKYILKYIKFNLVEKCPSCHREMRKNELLYCPDCQTDFFNNYIIDYDELNKIEIVIPDNKKSPYRNIDSLLEDYIQKKKPQSIKYEIDKLIPKSVEKLGVPQEECYMVELFIKYSNNLLGSLNEVCVMTILDDKISYISFGKITDVKGISLEGPYPEVSHIPFENINEFAKIYDLPGKFTIDGNRLIMKNGDVVVLGVLMGEDFTEIAYDAFEKFNNSKIELPETIDDGETNEIPDDVNPMEKIKEAKELLDIGAITQDEFDEIKNKYMKFI